MTKSARMVFLKSAGPETGIPLGVALWPQILNLACYVYGYSRLAWVYVATVPVNAIAHICIVYTLVKGIQIEQLLIITVIEHAVHGINGCQPIQAPNL